MIRQLRPRPRYDQLTTEVRRKRSRFGRWVYLGMLFAFFLWLSDTLVGPSLRLEADGLVVAEHVSVGVPFAAQVLEVSVLPGTVVARGDVLARVTSVDLAQNIATLTTRHAELLTRRADIERTTRVARSVLPIARDRASEAERALARIREIRDGGNVALVTWSQALGERFAASERVAEMQAELGSADEGLRALDAALADSVRALTVLQQAYADGVVRAPESGVLGLKIARPGEVLPIGQPITQIYRPERTVLAWLETGALYTVAAGDEVQLGNGFTRRSGRVVEVLPMADQLPDDFRKLFQPRGRGQVARIALADPEAFPLFSSVRVTGIGWLAPSSRLRVSFDRLRERLSSEPAAG